MHKATVMLVAILFAAIVLGMMYFTYLEYQSRHSVDYSDSTTL